MSNIRLVRGARLQWDEIRQQYILLLPEGALLLNSTAAAVLELCDGKHIQDEIVTELVEIYKNENVGKDVERLLSRLRDRGLIVDGVGENINNVRSPSSITSSLTNAKDIPFTLIAELTYRCPLRCPYCSNPVNYNDTQELPTEDWLRVIEQARSIGVWQLGFSGGEPLLRQDLEVLIAAAANTGLGCVAKNGRLK